MTRFPRPLDISRTIRQVGGMSAETSLSTSERHAVIRGRSSCREGFSITGTRRDSGCACPSSGCDCELGSAHRFGSAYHPANIGAFHDSHGCSVQPACGGRPWLRWDDTFPESKRAFIGQPSTRRNERPARLHGTDAEPSPVAGPFQQSGWILIQLILSHLDGFLTYSRLTPFLSLSPLVAFSPPSGRRHGGKAWIHFTDSTLL